MEKVSLPKKDKNIISKKKSGYRCTRVSVISPMMPKHFSAKERQEIRKKELQIIRGTNE